MGSFFRTLNVALFRDQREGHFQHLSLGSNKAVYLTMKRSNSRGVDKEDVGFLQSAVRLNNIAKWNFFITSSAAHINFMSEPGIISNPKERNLDFNFKNIGLSTAIAFKCLVSIPSIVIFGCTNLLNKADKVLSNGNKALSNFIKDGDDSKKTKLWKKAVVYPIKSVIYSARALLNVSAVGLAVPMVAMLGSNIALSKTANSLFNYIKNIDQVFEKNISRLGKAKKIDFSEHSKKEEVKTNKALSFIRGLSKLSFNLAVLPIMWPADMMIGMNSFVKHTEEKRSIGNIKTRRGGVKESKRSNIVELVSEMRKRVSNKTVSQITPIVKRPSNARTL